MGFLEEEEEEEEEEKGRGSYSKIYAVVCVYMCVSGEYFPTPKTLFLGPFIGFQI
ncbi:MAG: hypothetical protein Q8829_02615 [Candidatus Phytoplasma australasiaticum]|nr:hypothetical protein [Candidatus Phytoplasma australasiaticum]